MASIGPPQLVAVVAVTAVGVSLGRLTGDVDYSLIFGGFLGMLGFLGLVVTNVFPPTLHDQFPVLMVTFVNYIPIEVSGVILVAVFLDFVLSQDGFARS